MDADRYGGATTVTDWKELLRTDPRETLSELLSRLAARRSADPDLEDLFWRALVDYGEPHEVTRALLGRLRAAPGPTLLDLDQEHRTRCHGRLRVEAAEELGAFRLDPGEREAIAGHPLRLPETVYERRGRPAAAAALYALEHDRLAEREDAFGALARAALRYKLARALHRAASLERAGELGFAIMESALRQIEPGVGAQWSAQGTAPGGASPAMAVRLRFHVYEWLGLRHYEAERYAEAEESFLRAAALLPESELGVAVLVFAANALLHQGKRSEARHLLDSIQGRMRHLGPRDLAEEWEALYGQLEEELGEES